jgi:PKD repeat protein
MRGLLYLDDPEEMRKIGANYVEIVYWVEVDVNGTILPPTPTVINQDQNQTVLLIRRAHDTGLKVYLVLYPEYYDLSHIGELEVGGVEDKLGFMEQMEGVALEWASIAEENNVEIFSPTKELNVFVDWESAEKWYQSVLPRLRNVYHGELVRAGEVAWSKYNLSPIGDLSFFNFTGWDYVETIIAGIKGIGFWDSQETEVKSFEDYRSYVRTVIAYMTELKTKHNAKGVIFGEIQIPEGEGRLFKGYNLTLEEIKVNVWKILLDESLGKVDGFFFWSWRPGDEILIHDGEVIQARQGDGPMNLIRDYYFIEPPFVTFECDPQSPKAGESVTFNASASYSPEGRITDFRWDFGDNITSTLGPIVNHNYTRPGNYTVTLKVTDNNTLWNTMTKTIVVYYTGDLNQDGTVDIYDAILLANAYNSKPGDPSWNVAADINGDNIVDIYDAIILANNYGKTA